MATALQTKDLCKTYIVNKRQNNVLKNVDLTVEEGEMVAVMGPSGSGKSTLLYAVSGMDRITAGSVSFFGRDLGGMRPRELADTRLEEMGFIFQQMYMLKNLTVLDNIILPACQSSGQRAPRREIVARGEGLMRKLGIVETHFAELIWQHEPLTSGELVKLCEQELRWKKSTTYTVLKKLCEHGIFQNKNGMVTSILSQEEYNAMQSEKFVEETFDGSLPAFLAAFTTRKSLSEKDIAEIKQMIDRFGKE